MEVVWFKRDLRVHDHAPLVAAWPAAGRCCRFISSSPSCGRSRMPALGTMIFCAKPSPISIAACSARGSRLVVRVGPAVEVLRDLHAAHGITALHAHEETGNRWSFDRDIAVRRWARGAGVPVHEKRQHGVWRALGNRNGWAARWDAMMALPRLAAPPLPPAPRWRFACDGDPRRHAHATRYRPPRSALPMIRAPAVSAAAAATALATLAGFLDCRGRRYRTAMSAPVSGADHCSRLSPHLALGALSLREVCQSALTARARWREQGDGPFARSIDSFISRLHWHCHFIQKLEDAPWLAERCLHPGYAGLPQHDAARLAAWATGTTGWPFVDACMRSLAATGWLNFRMRAMVMAVASYHLRLDWRQSGLRAGAAVHRLRTRHPLAAGADAIRHHRHQHPAHLQSGETGP